MAPLVRAGGSRHTGLTAPPHRNIHRRNPEETTKVTIFTAVLTFSELEFPDIYHTLDHFDHFFYDLQQYLNGKVTELIGRSLEYFFMM